MRILAGLTALIAAAGVASAQNDPCPECDSDGPGVDNTYGSIDLGLLHGDNVTLVDEDHAVSHSDDEKGFWAWLSLCLSVYVERIENLLGVDTEADADANVDAYLSQDGIDLDATVKLDDEVCQGLDRNATAMLGDDGSCAFGYDRGELGALDGETWKVMSEVNAQLADAGVEDDRVPFPGETAPEIDEDLCIRLDAETVACG